MTEPITEVKIYNSNIDKIIIAEIPVKNGAIQYEGRFSIVDCVNTIVFVRARDVGLAGTELREGINGNAALLDTLEQVRVGGGILAGLIQPDEPVGTGTHSLPKLVIVAEPADYITSAKEMIRAADIDILSRYISMGGLHKAHAVGGALALAAACQIPGTSPTGWLPRPVRPCASATRQARCMRKPPSPGPLWIGLSRGRHAAEPPAD
ncbi:hypothetical protein J6TS7_56160 [Paenibacillus dendritiformis]|nr:hypothetical protein J6TS7_56160 [Paenibacillus dendritiformis]